MMKTIGKNIKDKLVCLACWLCGMMLAGCLDDQLVCGNDDASSGLAPDEYGISFAISLDNLGGAATRASFLDGEKGKNTDLDNYVNFETMRLLFFNKQDKFICDLLVDTHACNVIDRSTEKDGRLWYIELNLSKLGDDYEEEIRRLIEDEGFKVAVCANWDKRTTQAGSFPDFKSIVSNESLPEEPDYGDIDVARTHLSYIAHCTYDPTYSANVSNEGVPHVAYNHLLKKYKDDEKGYMGGWYDWVESHFATPDQAYTLMCSGDEMKTTDNADGMGGGNTLDGQNNDVARWIYQDTSEATSVLYSPTNRFYYVRKERDGEKYTFKDIWRIWNFSNGDKNICPYLDDYDNIPKKTYITNEQNIPDNELKNSTYKDKWKELNEGIYQNENESAVGWKPTSEGAFIFNGLNYKCRTTENGEKRDGGKITLASRSYTGEDYTPVKTDEGGWIYFQAATRGTVRVKAKLLSENATIYVCNASLSTNKYYELKEEKKENDEPSNGVVGDIKTYSVGIKVSDYTPDDIFIYAVNGTVEFYEVEFVKDEYLYYADRIGKEPLRGEDVSGIPMYGIQEFEPVGEYWLPGEYFNMSQSSNLQNRPQPEDKGPYKYRTIWMLRSVAKVELKISKSIGGAQNIKPSSVYMASMNRTSRYEPKDFSTPTNLIWYGSDDYQGTDYDYGERYVSDEKEPICGVEDEASSIKLHGPIYDKNNDTEETYQQFTSWLYGIWTDIIPDWNWNNVSELQSYTRTDNNPYPRVFNERIDRSNDTRFIFDAAASENSPYWHYYLYMPEKYIDNADDTGNRTTSPKVASIRLRFKDLDDDTDLNDDENIEDFHSYRIYFTENGRYGGYLGRSDYNSDNYERNREILRQHWPVIRNTLYRFTLNGLNSTDIKVEVCGAASREVDIPPFQ